MGNGNLYQRAALGMALTPGERALLRLVEGLIASALVAMLPVIAAALAQQNVNWNDVLRTAVAAGVTALLLALNKWATAHGDSAIPPAPTLTATVTTATTTESQSPI